MIKYVSTRGGASGTFTDTILEGLASDGGLLVPEKYEVISEERLAQWQNLPYPELACEVISCFATDLTKDKIRKICHEVYTSANFGDDIASVKPIKLAPKEDLYILGISNGPTLAFKDMAMQFLGKLFDEILNERGIKLNILGATSGDTGGAAEYAMMGRSSVSVFMLSPKDRMSEFQKSQMYSIKEQNIHNIVVPGSFDNCQDLVKAVSNDLRFKDSYSIGSVNSINWGRITAQVVYYFFGYFEVIKKSKKNLMHQVSFSVPSGNFGNILSGFVAKKMGLPIKNLVLATNENNVLDEFFKSGIYRVRSPKETFVTSSPSMDISKASNFERFIYEIFDRDSKYVSTLWTELGKNNSFSIDAQSLANLKRESGIVSGASRHVNRIDTIQRVYESNQLVVDPHTADGIFVGERFIEDNIPMICLETALPTKFESMVREALGFVPERRDSLKNIEDKERRVYEMNGSLSDLKNYIIKNAKIN